MTATAVVVMAAAPAVAQNVTVQGKVINPAGQPMAGVQVKFTKDTTKPEKERQYLNTVTTDAQGAYKAENVAPGDYVVVVMQGTVTADYQQVTFKARLLTST